MDVSADLQAYADRTSSALDRAVPVETDAGLLAAFDTAPVDASEYASLEPHLLALTLHSTQALLASLFSLPTTSDADLGPIARLPAPTTALPRAKPLPKPRPETKWERFAKAKGITHKNRDRKEWDDERQAWVNRWGKDGKNRDKEEQWLHEVKAGADPLADPRKAARDERKARVAKNERQHARNVAEAARASAAESGPSSSLPAKSKSHAAPSSAQNAARRATRAAELNRALLVSKTATASLGKFDRMIEGEPKAKGLKRKFEANEDVGAERARARAVLERVGKAEGRKEGAKKGGRGQEGGLNQRKAVREVTREQRRKK
ncbi:Rhodanese-related sulfurtransferase [Cryptotrichosporon argae]